VFEVYLEQIARKNNIMLPKKWEHYQEKVKKKGEGGLVIEPNRGLKMNVWACDFKSLYPNIIRTHNIGINNAVWSKKMMDRKDLKTKEGVAFKRHIKSLNAMIMDELIETRFKYRQLLNDPSLTKDERRWYGTMSDAYKLMLVSANGILDNKYFKFRNQRLYNATTMTGQWYTMAVKKIAERMGYKVHYGDTDSLFLDMPSSDHKKSIAAIPFIEDELNRRLKALAVKTFNLDPNNYYIDIRFEKAYSKIYFSEKKNYIGKMSWKDYKWLDPDDEDSTDAKGIVMMKYNTIPIVKEAMKEIFNILLSDIDSEKEINRQITSYLMKLKADLYAGKRDELLVKSQKVDRLDGYKSEPAHVRAAKKLELLGQFEPGMNVEYVEDKTGNILLYGIDTGKIAKRTYDFYWRQHVGKWVEKLVGREVSSVKALDFGYAKQSKSLLETAKEQGD
jgi:DNA polymerase I